MAKRRGTTIHLRGGWLNDYFAARMLCATCEGRAIGAGQLGAQEIGGRAVMFSPQRGEQ